MSHRYVPVAIETRRSDFYSDSTEVPELSAVWNLDLSLDGSHVEEHCHEDIHDHLLNLLEQYREEHTE